MFGSLYTSGRSGNPYGAEYNVPFRSIRPSENQVNIEGAGGGADQGDAFSAFSRFYMPFLQSQANLITGTGARPIDAQGNPIPGPPQQFGEDDFQTALKGMFQRSEDAGTLSKYRGFSPATRRAY